MVQSEYYVSHARCQRTSKRAATALASPACGRCALGTESNDQLRHGPGVSLFGSGTRHESDAARNSDRRCEMEAEKRPESEPVNRRPSCCSAALDPTLERPASAIEGATPDPQEAEEYCPNPKSRIAKPALLSILERACKGDLEALRWLADKEWSKSTLLNAGAFASASTRLPSVARKPAIAAWMLG